MQFFAYYCLSAPQIIYDPPSFNPDSNSIISWMTIAMQRFTIDLLKLVRFFELQMWILESKFIKRKWLIRRQLSSRDDCHRSLTRKSPKEFVQPSTERSSGCCWHTFAFCSWFSFSPLAPLPRPKTLKKLLTGNMMVSEKLLSLSVEMIMVVWSSKSVHFPCQWPSGSWRKTVSLEARARVYCGSACCMCCCGQTKRIVDVTHSGRNSSSSMLQHTCIQWIQVIAGESWQLSVISCLLTNVCLH